MYLNGKKLTATALAIAALLTLGACDAFGSDDANQKDVTGIPWQNPEVVEVFANVDQHPNIVVLCIHKVAWVTTSRTAGNNFQRVPEYDVPICKGVESKWAPRTVSGPAVDVQPTPAG